MMMPRNPAEMKAVFRWHQVLAEHRRFVGMSGGGGAPEEEEGGGAAATSGEKDTVAEEEAGLATSMHAEASLSAVRAGGGAGY